MSYLLGQEPATRLRYSAVSVSDFEVTRPTPSSTPIRGSIQPADGEEVQLLPEGNRHADMLAFYTKTELRTADQHAGTPADRVIFDGKTYEVKSVAHHRTHLRHFKALIARVDE